MALATKKSMPSLRKQHHSPRKTKSSKSIRFDEDNISRTRLMTSHYPGSMSFTEIKTPYPKNDPIEPSVLRRKMMAYLGSGRCQARQGSIVSTPPDCVSDTDIARIIAETIRNVSFDASEVDPPETFEEKRKKFYASEYILAQQRSLSDVIHGNPGQKYKSTGSMASKFSMMEEGSIHKYFRERDRDAA